MEIAEVKIAFEESVLTLPMEDILPLKAIPEHVKALTRYKRIARSIAEIGVIEPLVVSRQKDENGKHLLLDGHAPARNLDRAWRNKCALHPGL